MTQVPRKTDINACGIFMQQFMESLVYVGNQGRRQYKSQVSASYWARMTSAIVSQTILSLQPVTCIVCFIFF